MPAKKKISLSPAPEKAAPAAKGGATTPAPAKVSPAKPAVAPAPASPASSVASPAKSAPAKEAFTVKPETGPAPTPTPAPAATEEAPPPIVLPDDDVPLEVLEAAAVSAGEEGESYDYSANDDTPVAYGREAEDISYPGSKPFEAARERISPAVLELLDERLRASPKFLKKLPKPKAAPAAAPEAAALPEEVALPEDDEDVEDM